MGNQSIAPASRQAPRQGEAQRVQDSVAIKDQRPATAATHQLLQLMKQSPVVQQAKALQQRISQTQADRSSETAQLHPGAGTAAPGATTAGNNANVGVGNATQAWLQSPHANNALGPYVPPINGGQQTMGWAELQANGNTAKSAWVRFHLINSVIGGASTADNLVPTSSVANLSATWRQWEDTAKWLHQNGGVYMEVDITYGHGANVGAGPFPTNIQGHIPSQVDGTLYLPDTINGQYKANPGNGNGVPGIGNVGNKKQYIVSVPNPLPPVNPGSVKLNGKSEDWLRLHVYVDLDAEGARNIVAALANSHLGMYNEWQPYNLNQMPSGTVAEMLNSVQTWAELAGATDITINAHNNILNGLWTLN